jgi:RNA polymerase sigma-70 factor (sigma-E family)
VNFEEYAQQQGRALLRLAFLLTRDAHLAEDLVQAALLDAYRKWTKVQAADHADAYVRRIMVNTYLGWTRRRSWLERPGSDVSCETLAEVPDPAEAVALADQTRRMLQELAPKARTVLVLRYYADLDDAAIADLMGVTASTVRATASRALTSLRHLAKPATTKEQQ